MTKDKIIIIGGGILTIVIILGISVLLSNNPSKSSGIPDDKIVVKNGLHWHPRLAVYISGKKQEFQNNIGLGAIHQKMHTHDEDYKDGVVHMEMQGEVTKDETRLGKFFEIWGKTFNSGQIFEFKNSSDSAVKMLVNGKTNKDFENYQMNDGDKIEIRYE
ncbi:MAG: hypothetical protein AAB520_03350 [Patescibacteria group bacterium]